MASLVVQVVKYLPAVQETRVRSLGGEEPLEKGMSNLSTHNSPVTRDYLHPLVAGTQLCDLVELQGRLGNVVFYWAVSRVTQNSITGKETERGL